MTLKHVCLLGPVPPPWGGVQTHIMALRDRVRATGARCSIINVTRHRQAQHDDLYFPESPRDLLSQIGTLRPDIVHVHFGGEFFARQAALLVLLSARRRTKNVFTFHSGGFPTSSEGLRAKYWSPRGFALRQLDAVIGVNQALGDVFARYGVKKERIHVIEPFGGGLDRSVVVREPLPPEIEAFALSHSPLLLSVGLLEPEYGLDTQLDAFSAIRAEHPGAGLVMIGSGSLESDLRGAIAKHADRDHILLCGDVPRPKTLATIAKADLLLRTTHYDGDALSVREALSLGTRVLATNNGMRPVGVRLIERPDATALAAAVGPALSAAALTAPMPSSQVNPIDEVVGLYESLAQR